MVIQIGLAWLVSILLCAMRLGVVLAMTPLLDGFSVPSRIRMVLILALATALVSNMSPASATIATSLPAFFSAVVAELMTGSLLAFSILSAFGAVAFAGKVLDIQAGFGIGNVYDPITHAQSPLIGSMLGSLAIVTFFVTDAHHVLLRGIAFSMETIPLGSLLAVPAELIVRQFGVVFTLGLALTAPVIFCMFLLEIGLAVISRNLPQMNIFVLSVPVKIVICLSMLCVVASHFGDGFSKIFASIFGFWKNIL
jgi:flagellar biosynthetic protein FliR